MRRFLATTAAAALMMTGGAALAQSADWDANQDRMISPEEYEQNWDPGDTFSAYDTDGDGMISEEEWRRSQFDQFDRNRDQMWDEDEQAVFDDWDAPRGSDGISQ